MNKITLIGHVGHSAQVRATENGGMVTFTLAVNERRKNQQGEWENARTDWFDCVLYAQKKEAAEKIASLMPSGTRIALNGKMQSREYEKDGQKRTAWSVRVEDFELLTYKDKNDDPFANQ
jgi:single-strand DNA-binding protein